MLVPLSAQVGMMHGASNQTNQILVVIYAIFSVIRQINCSAYTYLPGSCIWLLPEA